MSGRSSWFIMLSPLFPYWSLSRYSTHYWKGGIEHFNCYYRPIFLFLVLSTFASCIWGLCCLVCISSWWIDSSWWINSSVNISCPRLCLLTVVDLKFILPDISIATPAFFGYYLHEILFSIFLLSVYSCAFI